MSILNIDKPTPSISNTDKISFAELWSSITSTWSSETRTWIDCISLFTNPDKTSTTITNINKP